MNKQYPQCPTGFHIFLFERIQAHLDPDGYFRESNRRLAKYSGTSHRKINNALRELRAADYIGHEVDRENGRVVERRIWLTEKALELLKRE